MPAVNSKHFNRDVYLKKKVKKEILENEDLLQDMVHWDKRIRQRKLDEVGFTKAQSRILDTLLFKLKNDCICPIKDACNCRKVNRKDTPEVSMAIQRAELPSRVENLFARAPDQVKVIIYESFNEKDKAVFLRWNVAYILEMAQRRGVNLNLGAILRCEALSWFNYPPLTHKEKTKGPTPSRKDLVKKVKQATLEPETPVTQAAKKPVWDRRALIILKAVRECGAVFFPQK